MVRIGTTDSNYNWTRNITQHEYDYFKFVKLIDPASLAFRFSRRISRQWASLKHIHTGPNFPGVDLLHFWRMISFGSKPWIVSTSTGLPFSMPKNFYPKAIATLASEKCYRILATSYFAKVWQRRKVDGYGTHADAILSKTEVLPPPQVLHVSSWEEKQELLGDHLELSIVGADLFRKGGLELLRAIDRLSREGAAIKLNVVSSLRIDSHAIGTIHKVKEAQKLIANNPSIAYASSLPNDKVIELFKRSHIGLLPSYIETYGYAVLEAQACGCATITTDVFALPEINPPTCGWQIPLSSSMNSTAAKAVSEDVSWYLEHSLYDLLCSLINDPVIVQEKAKGSIQRIMSEHNPTQHRNRLASIYEGAISSV